MAQPVPSRNRARRFVARTLVCCAVGVGFVAAAVGPAAAADGRRVSDTENTRTVYMVVAALVLVGCALLAFTMWFWRSTKSDHEALGPLEVLGDRRFRGCPPEQRLAMLDTARPVGAVPLGSIHSSDDGLVVEPAEIPGVKPEEAPAAEPSEPAVVEPVGSEVAEEPAAEQPPADADSAEPVGATAAEEPAAEQQIDNAGSAEAVGATADQQAQQEAIGCADEPVVEPDESVATDDAEPDADDAPITEDAAETEAFEAPAMAAAIVEPEELDVPASDDELDGEPGVTVVVEQGDEADGKDATVPVMVPTNGDHPSDDASQIEFDLIPVPEAASDQQPVANGVEPMVEAPFVRVETDADGRDGRAEEETAPTAVTTDTIEPQPAEPEPVAVTEPNHDDRGTVRSWLSSMWRR